MKILHLIPSYLPGSFAAGPIKPTHLLNRGLAARGVEVVVFTTNRDGRRELDVPLDRPVDIDGVSVRYFRSSFPRGWFYSRDLYRALRAHVAEFDLIHITSVFLAASTLGGRCARKFGKPYLVSPHGSLMREPLARKGRVKKVAYLALVERRNLAAAAGIHFTVEAERDEYLRAGLPLRRSFVIPNGFDARELAVRPPAGSFRRQFGIAPDRKIILSLGRINWKKGFDTLIPAFRRILAAEPRAFLVVAGTDDDGYRTAVEEMVRRAGVGVAVRFTGMLLGEAKAGAFADASVFVLPSYSENFGIAVAEALTAVPVVITSGVGVSPLVRRHDAGIVIEKTEEELAAAVLAVLRDPVLAARFRKNGVALVASEFSPDEVVGRFLDAYTECIRP